MNEIDTSTTLGKAHVMLAYLEGKDIQLANRYNYNWIDHKLTSHPSWNWGDYDYRIKPLEFPKLPEGLEWHNPAGLTPEQVEQGWRLLVKGERIPSDSFIWDHSVNQWIRAHHMGMYPGKCTYRVSSGNPLPDPPKPKVMVPLEPHNISPIDVLRKKDRKDFYAEHWMKIDAVNSDGPAVNFAGSGRIRIPFKTLMNEWEIKRPGEDWKPCEKESVS